LVVFEGATADAFETTFAFTDPTADRTITFPDSSFTVPSTGGKILQVFQSTKTDTTSTTNVAGNFADIADMTVDIQPSLSTSKVLVCWNIYMGASSGPHLVVRLMRDAATPFLGDAAGSRIRSVGSVVSNNGAGMYISSMVYLDDPTLTSVITYKLQWCLNVSGTLYLNRSADDTDTTAYERGASTITVMEIGA